MLLRVAAHGHGRGPDCGASTAEARAVVGAKAEASAGAGAGAGGNFSRGRHINFAARFPNRMQFFLARSPSAIGFQWQEAHPGGKWAADPGWDVHSPHPSASQLVSQPDKCGLCAARRPTQYTR